MDSPPGNETSLGGPPRPAYETLAGEGPPEPPKSRRKLWWVLGIVGALVAIAATAGIFLLRERPKPKALPPATTVADPTFGWAISFPKDWQRFDERNTGNVRLTVVGPEKKPYVALRVLANAYQNGVTEKDLPAIKEELTKGIREGIPDVEITSARTLKLNRLPAIHFVYEFTEVGGDQPLKLLHSHYYIFNGIKVEQIVFETSPESFDQYSRVFDAIAASFRSAPRRLSPAPASPSPSG